ncbi:MAG: hypothetical protein ISQ06_00705 [Planctomycetaceae bacterium]|nr:hypothetical protein [Planctomycetaceae bacterium]
MAAAGVTNESVSQLHEHVSRDLFGVLFPRWPRHEVPMRAITNGVHVPTWASRRAAELWGDATGGTLWQDRLDQVSQRVRELSAKRIWSFRNDRRRDLSVYISGRCDSQSRTGDSSGGNCDVGTLLDPNVLTTGFARRFATYKRANLLLLPDPNRLKRLLLDEHRPVQLLV